MGLSDFLFPKYCVGCKKLGSLLCASCFTFITFSDKAMCLVCGKHALHGFTHPVCIGKYTIDGCFISIRYDGIVKKLIYQYKYKPYLASLQTIFSDLFYEGIIQQEGFHHVLTKSNDILITPIPLHKAKLRKRGYNHAALLAEALAEKLSLPSGDCLIRVKETASQYGLKKEERHKNIAGAFDLWEGINIKNRTIFLIDDIVTTGATFLEAAKVLKKGGAKSVYGLSLSGED